MLKRMIVEYLYEFAGYDIASLSRMLVLLNRTATVTSTCAHYFGIQELFIIEGYQLRMNE